jgi:serine/threonine protein kinase
LIPFFIRYVEDFLTSIDDYDPRSLDVWSCAIVCLALFFRGTPWQAAKPEDANYSKFLAGWHKFLLRKPDGIITETEYPSCGRIFSALPKRSLKRLILQMLHPDPGRRIAIRDILEDRWMKTVECCCSESMKVDETDMSIDAADKHSGKLARIKLQRMHNHIPPEKKRG